MKYCPIISFHKQYVNENPCLEGLCAWWDPILDQCLVASFLQNNANTTPQDAINALIKKRGLDD